MTPRPPTASTGRVSAVVAREHRRRLRGTRATTCGDLRDVAAGFLHADHLLDVGEPRERRGQDVRRGAPGDVVDDEREGRSRARSPRSGRRCPPASACCSRARSAARRRRPRALAWRVSSIDSRVLFEPVPASTWTRPRAASTTICDHAPVLRVRERRGLARRAAGSQAVDARRRSGARRARAAPRSSTLAVAERRHQRREDSLEHRSVPLDADLPREDLRRRSGHETCAVRRRPGDLELTAAQLDREPCARRRRAGSMTTATAQAPLPQASVSPVPRSHVRCRMRRRATSSRTRRSPGSGTPDGARCAARASRPARARHSSTKSTRAGCPSTRTTRARAHRRRRGARRARVRARLRARSESSRARRRGAHVDRHATRPGAARRHDAAERLDADLVRAA